MKHPASLSVEDLLKNCQLVRTKRSGPGGQHRNKVETAVVVEHLPSGVRAEASERRSQAANRERALHRLRIKLALAVRTSPDVPSPVWTARVRGGQIAVNSNHADFPALLAEALDVLSGQQWSASEASDRLGVSTSQLVKLLAKEPAALRLANQRRHELGMSTLR